MTTSAADRELKQRHRMMWALGDYPTLAREIVAPLGERLAEAAAVNAGDRVLDVGAGTGNAAIAAARRGARVVASDLTPELLDAGRAWAREEGVDLDWVEADAEDLPFGDAEFDVVMSCIGAMFAPHHETTAAELLRVCRPGGTIAMVNWTPEGLVGDIFRTMAPFAPAPAPDAQPPIMWGTEDHVRELFGDAVRDLHMGRDVLAIDRFDTAQEYESYFSERFGPALVAQRNVAGDPQREQALRGNLLGVLERANLAQPGASAHFEQEYLLVVARRA
jgi:ubiquinone/menaquinone biosynthesis C-methylase UbiE